MANEKRKRQIGIGGLVEDNPLTSGATLLTSASLASITGGVGSTDHMPITLDPDGVDGAPEIAYITALTNGAGATGASGLVRGQEGTTARAHNVNTPWLHTPTLRDVVKSGRAIKNDVGGIINLNLSTWSDLATTLDIVLPAWPGDIIEYGYNAFVDSQAISGQLGVATRVSGATVTDINGYGGWWLEDNSQREQIGAAVQFRLVSGDISAGTVTLRPRFKMATTAGRTLFANSTGQALQVWATNLGPESA